jgi:hypothetical protein
MSESDVFLIAVLPAVFCVSAVCTFGVQRALSAVGCNLEMTLTCNECVLCARAVWRHDTRSVVTQRVIVLILYVLVRKQCYLREVFVKLFVCVTLIRFQLLLRV